VRGTIINYYVFLYVCLHVCVSPQPSEATSSKIASMKKKEEEAMEFGGPIGAVIGFISLPVMVYYLWICARFYGGLAYPEVGCVLLCM
jgi:hypothetical protein